MPDTFVELANGDSVHVAPSLEDGSRGMVLLMVMATRKSTRMAPTEAREIARMLMNAAHRAEKEAGK